MNTEHLSIFIFSFAGLDAAKSSIKSLDTWMDLEKDYGLAGFRKATDLRKTWPHLKVNVNQKEKIQNTKTYKKTQTCKNAGFRNVTDLRKT